ncbi:MAG: calcium-binding protein [Xenococcaceae cyanobacterium MO_234.B1]|nr:calcium-binding protein [Xenococcaceae cyanobacterium MO_234.B1]
MLSLDHVFNESYYLETNSEAAQAVARGDFASGQEHFEAVGLDEGLRFSPFINLDYYKQVANPDLSDLTNRQALDHLLEVGIEEGRIFSQFVDLEFYKEANPDISDLSNAEALLHLQDIGLEEGRQFSSFVDLEEYRSFNPELSTQSLSDAFTNLATYFAPDDEGRIHIPLAAAGNSLPDEVDIVTPEMLAGSAEATITYSKSANEVVMEFDFEGLPYQLDVTRPDDVSTPFNQQPVSVEDGKWQIWIMSNWFNRETNFWYDGATGELIGNEFELPNGPPEPGSAIDVNGDGVNDTSLAVPTTRMIGTPIFEGNPDGTAHVEFTFDYDQMLDDRGTGGAYVAGLPFNLNHPEEIGIYYTEGGLPLSEAMSFDDILTSMRDGGPGLVFATSLEPDPKPEYLNSRDNTMIAWSSFYPALTPDGVLMDLSITPLNPFDGYRFQTPEDLQTHVNDPTPFTAAKIAAETELVFGGLEADEFDAADPNDDFDGNRDTLLTGAGEDFVDATSVDFASGRNRIFGGTGLDEILAGRRDRVSGGTGDDILDASAGLGNNRLYGSDGNDELFAGESDRLFAGAGDDILDATTGSGDNRLYGQDGNDTFFLGSGDRILGGDGDDAFFVTDGGDNLITGGAGADAFWIATGELITTANTITDFELDGDVIGVAGLGATSVDDLELSQVGNDAVISFSGFDLATLLNTQASDLAADGTFVFA